MKIKHLIATTLLATTAISALAADVGVSVSVSQPGLYGRIDIGNVPQPQVIYPQPVVIAPVPVGVVYQPLYLHVRPGHERKWRKHCHKYNACGRPVYFVQSSWYNDVYVPAKRGGGGHRHHDHNDDHGGGKHDKHGKGHGNGKGNGHGKGH